MKKVYVLFRLLTLSTCLLLLATPQLFAQTSTGSIGDLTYCDNNNNGTFDAGDIAATGLTVTLCDVNFVTLATQAVDANGKFLFQNLAAGTYNVKFPESTIDGKPQVNLGLITVVLADGQAFLDADKGYYKAPVTTIPTACIGDLTYCDNNNNGVFDAGDIPATGLTVTLCDVNFVTLATQAVDANGKYLFQNLAAGTYNVKFPEITPDGKPQRVLGLITVVLADAQKFLDADKGYYKAPPVASGCIGGLTYNDNNSNAGFDAGDAPATGMLITLCDANLVTIATQSVDANGKYQFLNLAAGTYNIKFPDTTPDGKPQVIVGVKNIVLSDAQKVLNADKGYYKASILPTACIGDLAYCDNNNNGIFDAGDIPATGLTITLCDANFVTLATQLVDANGKYLFQNLAAGTYNVKFPEATVDGKPQRVLGLINVVLAANQKFLDADKGYYKAPLPPACSFNIDVTKCFRLTTKNNPNSLTSYTQTFLFLSKTTCIQSVFVNYEQTQIFKFEKLTNGAYKIIEQKSGKALTLENGSCSLGNNLTLNSYSGSTSQQFKLECVENGYFKLIPLCCPNNVIDLGSGTTTSGKEAVLATYGAKDCQKWQAVEVECSNPCATDVTKPTITCPAPITKDVTGMTGTCWTISYPNPTATDNCAAPTITRTSGAASGSCFPIGTYPIDFKATDAKGNYSTCSFNIVIKSTASVCNTNFSSTKCYRIVNVGSGKTLDVNGGGTGLNTPIIQWPYHGGVNQQIRLYALGSGYFKILFRNSGRVLANHYTTSGSNCYLYDYYTGGFKDWKIDCNTDGTYLITHRASGKVLDIENDATSDGANVEIRTYDGSNSQKWRIEEVICNTATSYLTSKNVLTMDASAEPLRTRIEWINNTGFKNDYFAVQKINNTTGQFEDIETLNAASQTDDLQHFGTYDNQPTEGDNFYRIKVAYTDGTFAYTEIKKVTFDKMSGVRIYPNPASDAVDIDLSKYKGNEVNVYFYNPFGQIMLFQNMEKVGDTPLSIDVSKLATGRYLLRVTSKGKRDDTKQLIIAH